MTIWAELSLTAGFPNMLLRNSDIVPIADMTGNIEFGGIWKKRGRSFGVPAYWVFRLYSNADTAHLVQVDTNSETYDVEHGSVRLPDIKNVSYADIVATLNDMGDRLTLFCVNRNLTQNIPLRIHIDGFPAAQQWLTRFMPTIFTKRTMRRLPNTSGRRTARSA